MPLLKKVTDRNYVVNGERLLSVTEVLQAVGIIREFGSDAAMDRGTRVHRACCDIDLGLNPTIEDEDVPYVEAYRAFLNITGAEPVLIEQPVYHETHRYAGTLDRLYLIGGAERWLADIKTGSLPKHTPIQLSAYAACLDKPVWKRCAIHLIGDGKYRIVHYPAHEAPRDLDVFLAALKVAKWRKENP
jgi:hypothetical protein